MAQQGAALQNYNNELVKSLEELQRRKAHLDDQIKAESLTKAKLETEKSQLEEKLSNVEVCKFENKKKIEEDCSLLAFKKF